jgi:hypothetical protein
MVKGIVIEKGKGYVIAMSSDGEFKKITCNSSVYSVGEEIVIKEKGNWSFGWKKIAAIAAILLLVIIPLTLTDVFNNNGNTPVLAAVSYITIDINPSMEIGLDKEGKVVSVAPMNDDGERVLLSVNVLGLLYDEAVEKLIEGAALLGFLKEDVENGIVVTFTQLGQEVIEKDKVGKAVEKKLKEKNLGSYVQVTEVSGEVRGKAKEAKVSPAALVIREQVAEYLEAKELNEDVDIRTIIQKVGIAKAFERAEFKGKVPPKGLTKLPPGLVKDKDKDEAVNNISIDTDIETLQDTDRDTEDRDTEDRDTDRELKKGKKVEKDIGKDKDDSEVDQKVPPGLEKKEQRENSNQGQPSWIRNILNRLSPNRKNR